MTDRRALVVLVLVHAAIVAIVQPRGDFPLNDDWAYAHSVQWLLDEHRIRLSQWVGMNLVPQALAGAAVTALFGFSFETLRHLTQAVAIAAMVLAYAWFRTAKLEPLHALVATCAVVAFPAWGPLANSFMTDLYGLALGLGAAICFVRALQDPSRRWIVAGTAIAMAGVLQRQVVLVIPFAFMVTLLWTRRPRPASLVALAVLPFIVCLAAEVAFHAYLASGPGVPGGQRMAHERLLPFVLKAFTNTDGVLVWQLSNLAQIAGLLGLFSFGWFLWWGMGALTRTTFLARLGVAAVLAVAFIALDWYPPYRGLQLLDRAGIGPFMLYDETRSVAPLDRSPGLFWIAAGVAAALGVAALGVLLVRSLAAAVARPADPILAFCVVACLAYLGPFVITDYFERYLLFVLPFIFAAWARIGPSSPASCRRGVALACIALVTGLGALATRDYFSWNRARWDAIRLAERLGATADTLDGGFEYNGFHRFERAQGVSLAGKSWYWVKDDVHVVAFSKIQGYEVVETFRVPHVLPRSPGQVLLLRRSS